MKFSMPSDSVVIRSIKFKFKTVLQNLPNTACTGQVRGVARTFGESASKADSASGGFVRQFPPLPVTPAVSPLHGNLHKPVFFKGSGPTAGVTGKGGTWRTKPPDAESAFGADSPKVWANARTCPVHAVLGAFTERKQTCSIMNYKPIMIRFYPQLLYI